LNEEAEKSFYEPNEEIKRLNRLIGFDEKKETVIFCDASGESLGAIRCHGTKGTDEEQMVQYASRVLQEVEKRYSDRERELLAIPLAVMKKFCYNCEARKVVVHTEHKALLGEIKLSEESRRSVRFIMKIVEFDLDIRHVEGEKNIAPDAISRNVGRPLRELIFSIIRKKHEKKNTAVGKWCMKNKKKRI
jgi:RNase H-like domain found in reverse transcriptase